MTRRYGAIASVLVATTSCGRFDFARVSLDSADASVDAALLPDSLRVSAACNVPSDLGPITDLALDGHGFHWLATTSTAEGAILAYASTAGANALRLSIDDVHNTFERGPALVGVLPAVYDDLSVAASADRALFSAAAGSAAGQGITVASADLALTSVNAPTTLTFISVGAPDHVAALANGSFAIAGGNVQNIAVMVIKADGSLVGISQQPFSTGDIVMGASLEPGADGSFIGGWFEAPSPRSCDLHFINSDGSIRATPTSNIGTCRNIRVVETADEHVGVSYLGGGVNIDTLSPSLAPATTMRFTTAEFGTTRMALAADAYWTAASADTMGSLYVVGTNIGGEVELSRQIEPFTQVTGDYLFDVFQHDGTPYALWMSSATNPELYMMLLCPGS